MSRLTQKGQGSPLALFSQSTDSSLTTMTGARFDASDGREFVLVLVGASNIGDALLVQSSAIVTEHQNLAVAAAATGATSVTVTLAGAAATLNQYQGGYALVNAGTNSGQTLKIASNPAQTATGGTLVVTLEDALTGNLSASDSKVSLIANPYLNVIVSPATTLTGQIVGATLYPVTAANYALITTKGLNALFSESNVATVAGAGIIGAAATAGWGRSATGTTGFGQVGVAFQAAVSAEARGVVLDL